MNGRSEAEAARRRAGYSSSSSSRRLSLLLAVISIITLVAASPRYIGPPPEVAASAGIARSQPAQQSRHDHRSESIERLPDALRRYRFNAGPAISRRSGSTLAVKSVGSNTDNDIHDNGRIVSVDLESHDELAEIALVVTVDGAIHAIRRDTGLWVWSLHDENESAQTDDIVRSPLVRSSSTSGAGDDSSEHYTDDEVYVIEPHSGGDIYMYHKSTGQMQRLPLSVTQLVDLSPFTFPTDVHSSTEANATSGSSGDGKLFLGRKETKLVGVDISSGKLVGEFGPEAGWCEWPQTRTTSPAASSTIHTDDGEGIEHRPWHLLYIGRTDYHLSIYSKKHGLLQTLSYTAYGPSTLANPSAPHSSSTYSDSPTSLSLDGRYIQPMHDGSLVCFESDRDGLQWSNHFSHPVVSVFDIVHPASAAQSNPASSFTDDGRTRSTSDRPHPRSQPVVVVHPTQILHSSISALRHVPATTYVGRIPTYNINSSARVGEDQFFAMSNDHYPLIAFANPAVPGSGSVDQSDDSAIAHVHGILGVHKIEEPLDSGRTIDPKPEPLGIDAGPSRPSSDETHSKPAVPALPDGTKDSKQLRLGKSLDFRYLLQTATLAVTMACVFLYFRRILRKRQRLSREPRIRYESVSVSKVEKAEPPPSEGSSSASTESIPMHISVKDLPSSSLIASDGTSRHVYSPSIDKALPALPPFEEINENNETDNQALSVTPPMVDSAVDLDSDGEDDDVVKTGNKKKGRRRKRGKRPGQRATDAVASNEAIDGVQARQAAPIAAAIIPKLSPVPVVDIPPPVVDERDGIAGRIGSLIVSEQIIGYGSHGTVVLKGTFQGRAVAVKRLLKDFVTVASHEVKLLQESDDHSNVIRYFCQEQRDNFLYIALELCSASLYEIIDSPASFPALAVAFDPVKALKQITRGLMHLHKLKIIHRDLKPQNILITASSRSSSSTAPSVQPSLRVVISDFGLCKKLDVDESSFLQSVRGGGHTAPGSFGYRAPEVLRGEVDADDLVNNESPGREHIDVSNSSSGTANSSSTTTIALSTPAGSRKLTRSIDIFSLGCIFYFVLTMGEHPFGSRYEREVNILNDRMGLDGLSVMTENKFEAQELVKYMCHADPSSRPCAADILLHPFFWQSAKSLHFLCDASDRFEIMDKEGKEGDTVYCLEDGAEDIIGRDWLRNGLDRALVDNLGKYRKYDGGSVRDLMRVLRNKKHHYQDLPDNVRKSLGEPPAGFLSYFTRRFPKLLMHVHGVVRAKLSHEAMFSSYFELQEDN